MVQENQKGGDLRELYLKHRGLERGLEAESLVQSNMDSNEHLANVDQLLTESDLIFALDQSNIDFESDGKNEEQSEAAKLATVEMDSMSDLLTEDKIRQLSQEGFERMYKFMNVYRKVEDIKKKLEKALNDLIVSLHENTITRESTLTWQKVNQIEKRINQIADKIEILANENPESFLTYGLLRLRKYKKEFETTGLIETPGIERITGKLMKDVRKQLEGTNGIVVLLGDTGSGKTVVARKIASELSENGEFEFVGAHSRMTPDDLLHRFGIVVEDFSAEKIPQLIKEAQAKYSSEHDNLSKEELKADLDIIATSIQEHASEKVMTTKKIKEAVERAMEKGVIVVIDEFNYLPPETLASLNDILSNTKSKKGFGVIMTGNIGKKFKNRKDLDPAFINRIASGAIEYNYPPQEFDLILSESIISSEQASAGEEVKPRDLFISGLVQSVDTKGNLVGPNDTLDNLWDLSQSFAIIQQLATDKDIRELGLDPAAISNTSKFDFKSFFLSFRNYNNIVREWKMDGYNYSLDWYIYKNIIKPATILAPREAAQLFYIFQIRDQIFQGEMWQGVKVDSQSWSISGLDTVHTKEEFVQDNKKQKYFSPQEVVESAFGREMPGYESVDEQKNSKETVEQEKFTMEMEQLQAQSELFITENNYVFEVCQEQKS